MLPVEGCERLLRAAEGFEGGRLVPYVALCVFGGLRPFEAARLSWEQVNLGGKEIRLKGGQTKTGKGRIVEIRPTLKAWLSCYKGQDEIYRAAFDVELRELRASIGYGEPTKENSELKPWVPDILRHTAISHYFRTTGSYGRTAEQFGNSESIIKMHYQSQVSSKDTKRFYALRPGAGARPQVKPTETKRKRAQVVKQVPKVAPTAANVVALPVDVAA